MASLGEDLLGIVNKLQDLVFNTIGNDSLDLPQIVVVGSQSSGKSSVLENIVGRDFLPRGSGIVTRRPLILQLINVPSERDDKPENDEVHVPHTAASVAGQGEWAEFHHIPGQKFHDFAEVKREIENETARIAGNNKGINRQPINLKIYSPHVLSLTLVDLPGLTKVPIGDQPSDIERQTRNLISEYIAKPNSIILAVSPANVDIVNSEALKLARHVDPMGRRTIGVLTKLDLMDHGTNALDILSGRVYPLKLGFIGVVNRSQQDIQGNKSLAEALKSEAEFFRHHPAYRNMANRCGTQFLAKSLNITLMSHIRDRLPDIKARLNTLMGQTQQELASYGNKQFSGKEHRGSLILQLMTRFASSFISSIDGTSSEISTKELCGGARIYYIFNSVFGNSLETIDPTMNLSVLDIRTAIRNSTGPRPSLFVPELAFDLLVKPQIKMLEIPSQRCVELVYEELIKICHTCGSTELSRFPRLQAKLIEVVSDLLRERLGPSSNYVESLISIQRAYINTNHPNFLGAAAAMSSVIQNKQEKEKKAALAEARRKRDRRQIKGLGAVNGVETPDDDEIQDEKESQGLPVRGPATKVGRSRSPAVGRPMENGNGHVTGMVHAGRSTSPPRYSGQAAGNTRDSFLNYFFGKEGGLPASAGSVALGGTAAAAAMGNRHVSHSVEPSFSQSIRRGENRMLERSPQQSQFPQDDYDLPPTSRDYDYSSPFANGADEPALTEREALETELIRRLISSYFNIVRETIADQVPKAVMHLLVNHSKDAVQNRLVSELYKEELFGDLLYEDDGIKAEREKCEKLLATYREAAKIVDGSVLVSNPSVTFYQYPNYKVNHFAAREDPLNEILQHHQSHERAVTAKVVVLQGMGGCGKSQLALEYCERAQRDKRFSVIFWIDATSATMVAQSYTVIAETILKGKTNATNEEASIRVLPQTLSTWTMPWLLVFDNFDEPKAFDKKPIKGFFPRGGTGSILITSRHTASKSLGHPITVTNMLEKEALNLLFRRSGYEKNDENVAEGIRIVKRLCYLALAIDQAGAYISARNLGLPLFMDHYENRRKKVLEEIPDVWNYRRKKNETQAEQLLSVATKWELSYGQIGGHIDNTLDRKIRILYLAAFFDSKSISEELFEADCKAAQAGRAKFLLQSAPVWDRYEFLDMIAELRNLSLIQNIDGGATVISFSLHPLIQDWIKLRAGPGTCYEITTLAIAILHVYMRTKTVEKMTFPEKQTVLSHLATALDNDKNYSMHGTPLGEGFLSPSAVYFAEFFRRHGRYNEAATLLRKVLAGQEKERGPGDLATAQTAQNLAVIYRTLGQYSTAETLCNQSLMTIMKKLGADHTSTLLTNQNLAMIYWAQKRYSEAETLFKEALTGLKKGLGPHHEHALSTAQNLALVYEAQGRYVEAEILNKEALKGQEKQLGSKHPNTLMTAQNLACVYLKQGRLVEAELLQIQALKGRETELGLEHPETLRTAYNLGQLYFLRGRNDQAEVLYRRALRGQEKLLGPEHPDTQITVKNLKLLQHHRNSAPLAAASSGS